MNETEIRVYYADTDHGQVVYYANFLKWFEVGRTELLRSAGLEYAAFEREGLIAPVVDVHCAYKAPARYNDIIIIKTSIEKIGNSSMTFTYEAIRKTDGELLALGSTVNVFIDMKTMKPVSIPKAMRDVLS